MSTAGAAPAARPHGDGLGAQHYATRLGVYDEMLAGEQKMLPYWESFISAIDGLGVAELDRRRREAQRLLRENGVTYNVYGDDQKLARPWRLDPIPLLISAEEWAVLEAGIEQRARLLDLILKDMYGKQTLLKKGLLPCELVFAHQGFLPACVGAIAKQGRQLGVYAANVVRGAGGGFWVLDDRAQAPSGFGYALENRAVMARILPDILRQTRVRKLGEFFKAFGKHLAELAPANKDHPRVVVLTPGPFNETYFEHAYLAAYLGYTLVQGDDLAVRDGHVWLKSLAGLRPVDVILRRVDDHFCDPLSLRCDSRLGVPGLLEAVRRGHVAVANPLGSGVLENPALSAFLPGLARYFLRQDLLLPSVATWWCGQRREREFVLANLDKLVIKHINHQANEWIVGAELDSGRRGALAAAIAAKPHGYVGQEQFSLSTVPAFMDQRMEPRNAVMRGFAVADGDGYRVMPGGLTRVARDKDGLMVSSQLGGLSKDTWVLAGQDGQPPPPTPPPPRPARPGVAEPLASRAADHLFWVGRYLERMDASARLLRAVLARYRECQEFNDDLDWQCLAVLLPVLGRVTGRALDAGAARGAGLEAELLAVACDHKRAGGLHANIQAWAQAAFSVRDLWSQDTWRGADAIQHRWRQRPLTGLEALQTSLDELVMGVVAFSGLTNDSMAREAGWLLLDSGRRLERALLLAALLAGGLCQPHAPALMQQVLEAILEATDSFSVYQRRYRAVMQLPLALELLLFDPSHPRSLAYQLERLWAHIGQLPKEGGGLGEPERLALRAYTDLRLLTVEEALAEEAPGQPRLAAVLARTSQLLCRLADVIAQAYFNHAQAAQLVTAQAIVEDEL